MLTDRLLSIPAGRPAILARLALDPDWRARYFAGNIAMQPPQVLMVRAEALQSLAGTANPPTAQEARALIAALIAAEIYDPARKLWRLTGHAEPPASVSDPDFAGATGDASTATAFDWQLNSLGGVDSMVDRSGTNGSTLHITSDGNASGIVAQQLLLLRPGQHRLTLQARYSSFAAADALRWRIRCGPPGGGGLSFPAAPPTSARWNQPVMLDFSVPAEDCAAQWLELVVQPVSPPASTDAWFGAAAIG